MRNSPADTKVSEGGGGGAPGAGAEVPLQPVERPMVEQPVPIQPTGPTADQISTLQLSYDQRPHCPSDVFQ